MSYVLTYLAGCLTIYLIYHFGLQPILKAKRDAAEQKLTDFLKGKGKGGQ